MDLNIPNVPAVAEISDVALHLGMSDGEAAVIWLEVSFGYRGLMLGPVWQYVIPRTVLGWPRPGHGFVPCAGSPKVHIDVDDYASVIEESVLHKVTN